GRVTGQKLVGRLGKAVLRVLSRSSKQTGGFPDGRSIANRLVQRLSTHFGQPEALNFAGQYRSRAVASKIGVELHGDGRVHEVPGAGIASTHFSRQRAALPQVELLVVVLRDDERISGHDGRGNLLLAFRRLALAAGKRGLVLFLVVIENDAHVLPNAR